MKPRGILETAVYVSDLEAAERFYAGVLGLEVILREAGRHVFFRCGVGVFLVFHPEATLHPSPAPGRISIPPHGCHGYEHVAFRVNDAELDAWRERLLGAGVAIESEITWPKGGRSIFFRDPSGNSIELATPALWQLPENL